MTLLGPVCALLSSVTWAIGSSRYSVLSRAHSAFSVNLARALFALPLFLVTVFVSSNGGWHQGLEQFTSLNFSHIGWFAVSMIASYGLGDVLFLASTRTLGVPTALAIASCYPIWTAAAAWLFRSESLAGFQWLGLFLAVLGIVLVIVHSRDHQSEPGEKSENSKRARNTGLILAFLTSFMWALNSYSCAQGGADISAAVANSIRMVFAIFFSVLLAKLVKSKAPLLLPGTVLRASAWIFVLEAFGGSYFYMYGLTHSPLAAAATLSSLAPVLSVPIAWLLGIEKFSLLRTVAILIAVIGVCLLLAAGRSV
ncbi:MAG: hypothetical protein A2070_05820 [Bdellovibrionales bacterium GWC1_52_8]|nr:MAG: hypothetical protein A2X97_05285 [Bdellovibrionales bacterium GWA1_52_35]OFZ34641.1 MAG: hypothetical protein A2070_05820 [Bdellovibrionales bacterium GWC1_52_8]